MQELNKQLLQHLNGLLDHSYVEYMVRMFADGPIFFIPIFLLFFWFYYNYKKKMKNKQKLLYIFYSCVLAIGVSLIIQQFISIERPETAIKGTGTLILEHIPDASFPSDHATVSFAFLLALYFWNFRRIFYIFLPFCLIMNLSRVIAGVHRPFDILAGAFVGAFASYIIYRYQKQQYIQKCNEWILKIAGMFKL